MFDAMPSSSGTRTRRTAAQTREHVLQVANDLFYWQGIRATGIDKVATEAGVASTTLYRLFASKDDLVAAYVERNGQGYREWMAAATAPSVGPSRARILALFDALAEQVRPEHCRGCPFLMALAEFPDASTPAHHHAAATKAWVREHLRDLARELARDAPLRDPAALGDQLALLVEGVYASVQALGDDGPATQARATAETLIEAAAATPSATTAPP